MKKLIALLLISAQAMAASTTQLPSNVTIPKSAAIGTTTAAAASAALDVVSTTKGARPCPPMTQTQRDAIASPATGLCVFNTSTGIENQYNGSLWVALGGVAAYRAPTVQRFTSTGTQTGWLFTVTAANATVGATYTNNANTYTVLGTISGGTQLWMSGTGATSGTTLTKATGTGDATITFSTKVATATYTTPTSPAPLYIKIKMVGAGGSGGGGGVSSGNGAAGGATYFGPSILIAGGGDGGEAATNETTPAHGGSATVNSPALAVVSVQGGDGGAANQGAPSANAVPAGIGGSSFFGGAGAPGGQATPVSGQNAKANSGSGGGGGANSTAGSGSGGGGASGGYVEGWITSSIAASYPYIVGAKGSSPANAGTSGGAGGDGGDGIVIVEEHYQ